MFKQLIFSALISFSFSQPQTAYIYESCVQNNNLNFSESPGGTIYFSQYDRNNSAKDYGLMNNSYIYDCLIVLKGKPQGTFPYKRFFGLHFRLWNYDTNSGSRYDANLINSYYPNISSNIQAVCGNTCKTGCMQLIHPEYKTTVNLCGANQLTGKDYTEYFQQDFLMLRFYLLGGIYIYDNTTNTTIIRPTTNFIIDYFSFYYGKCIDSTNEFQCINTDRCIDIALKCDAYGGIDCGKTSSETTSYDQSVCSQSATSTTVSPTSNSIYSLFILLLPFLILFSIFLCYRPGYCCWRCARLRNCPHTSKASCAKRCTYSCVTGNGPNLCQCCKFASKSPTSKKSICCCRNCDGSTNNSLYNNYSKNKIMPYNSNAYYLENENTLGDGYHLRECR